LQTKFNFTKTRLDKIVNPISGRTEYFDSIQHGLCLRVTTTGKKTFRLNMWDKKRKKPSRETIGEYPTLGINDARKIVAKRVVEISEGIDTVARRRKEREEQTLNDVFVIWLEEHAKQNCKRWDHEQRRYELYIEPHLGKKQLSEITPDIVRRWKIKLSKQKKQRGDGLLSKAMVHRATIVLSSIFGKTAPQLLNPCSQVDKYKPKPRTVFLGTDQLKIFFEALDHVETPEWLKDYLLISLYTGARRSNVLAMSWGQVDLNLKLWIIPGDEMKNEEAMVIPLLDQAVEILMRRKENTSSVFVFSSARNKTGHITEPKRPWKEMLIRAGLDTGYRLHDIRRTMGSWQAISGSSTKLIGASLGHKSEQATAHYAHLTIDPVRASMERAATAMDKAKDSPGKVVAIRE